MGFASRACIPCRGASPPLSEDEAKAFLAEVPGWTLAEGANRIERGFRFADFATAMEFSRKVGELAEREGHHPDISFGWGYCAVSFHTHRINGLHENDFIMAAKVNTLCGQEGQERKKGQG